MNERREHVGTYERPMRRWSALRTGLILGLMLWSLVGLLWAVVSHGAEGLPEAGIPDLYDPTIVSSFQTVRRAPYGPYTSTILTSGMAYSLAENGRRESVVYVLGYLTEPRGRIVAIVQTWIHPPGLRNVRAFYDLDWVDGRSAKGVWGHLSDSGSGISPPMTKAQTTEHLQPLMRKITARMGANE